MAPKIKQKVCEKRKIEKLFPQPPKYSNSVLVDPWYHDRLNALDIPKNYQKPISSYRADYTPKPRVSDSSQMWNMILKSEDSNFIRETNQRIYPNFFDNFSTLYDLSYNHFPKWYKNEIPGTHNDYISSYGNVTNYGLVEHKKEKWSCAVQDPRKNVTTSYRMNYEAPKIEDYNFKRFGIPLSNSSIILPVNNLNVALNLRNNPSFTVPTSKLVTIPRSQHQNPITWEYEPEIPATCCKKYV